MGEYRNVKIVLWVFAGVTVMRHWDVQQMKVFSADYTHWVASLKSYPAVKKVALSAKSAT